MIAANDLTNKPYGGAPCLLVSRADQSVPQVARQIVLAMMMMMMMKRMRMLVLMACERASGFTRYARGCSFAHR